jgi:hypothetical protein
VAARRAYQLALMGAGAQLQLWPAERSSRETNSTNDARSLDAFAASAYDHVGLCSTLTACARMPLRRNVTLSLDDEIIQKARVLAARRNLSVSALLRDELSRLVAEDDAYQTAMHAALERLKRGSRLGGGRLPKRDELHERADLR